MRREGQFVNNTDRGKKGENAGGGTGKRHRHLGTLQVE